jgi:pilus assembly protein CpaE
MALMMNVTPRRPVSELVNEIRDLDIDLLETFLAPHESGVKVLPSSFNPEFAEYVSGEHVEKILSLLQQNYDYVLVDSPSFFHGPIITAMDNSDLVLIVGTPDLATIYNLKSCTMVMESLNYSKSKLKLVLNKANRQYGVRPRDVESTLNLSIFCEAPADDKLALTAVNKGIPFAQSNPEARLSRAVQELAKQLINDAGGVGADERAAN